MSGFYYSSVVRVSDWHAFSKKNENWTSKGHISFKCYKRLREFETNLCKKWVSVGCLDTFPAETMLTGMRVIYNLSV